MLLNGIDFCAIFYQTNVTVIDVIKNRIKYDKRNNFLLLNASANVRTYVPVATSQSEYSTRVNTAGMSKHRRTFFKLCHFPATFCIFNKEQYGSGISGPGSLGIGE